MKAVVKTILNGAAKCAIELVRTGDAPADFGSHIGGAPAAPLDFEWPTYTDEDGVTRPLAFMAQISLAEAAAFDWDDLLPKAGLLSFFYEIESQPWGIFPSDKGSARVFLFEDEAGLAVREAPSGCAVLPGSAVAPRPRLSLPAQEDIDPDFSVDADEYDEACMELGFDVEKEEGITKLLGWPDLIQGPMRGDCERIARGYSCGDPEDYASTPEEEAKEIAAHAEDWMLLFQMASAFDGEGFPDEAGPMFGDCGNIYYWIRRGDLERRDLDGVWLMLQCG